MENNILDRFSIQCEFIPFSQSRNKDSKYKNFNWNVAVSFDGRKFLDVVFNMGANVSPNYPYKNNYDGRRLETFETENGKVGRVASWGEFPAKLPNGKSNKIEPPKKDVIACIFWDSSALDYASFKDWAENYGYDSDSISAKATYDACMDEALKLRNAIGEDGLKELGKIFENF